VLRAEVTAVSTAGVWVLTADYGVVGPCQYVGAAPDVGDPVLVADVGGPSRPDLVVIGVIV